LLNSNGRNIRALIVDLNNFARYPTIAVGYLSSVLRGHGVDVTVLSPLAHDVSGVTREPRETRLINVGRRISYTLNQMPGVLTDKARSLINKARTHIGSRHYPKISDLFDAAQPADFDVVLVSTYLMYYPVCREIGLICDQVGVPLLIGGSYFSEREVAQSWLDLPGLHAIIGGEVEFEIAAILGTAIERGDLSRFDGVWLPDGRGRNRKPLQTLDKISFPDYSDFPWDKYPHRIIPMVTGRGCGWGACTFCSDVTSTAGRTYRSRSPANVLQEAEYQSKRLGTSLFVFVDLKLNSDGPVWQAITSQLAERVHNPSWIGSIHVGSKDPNGLDLESLKRARKSGAVRLTTGLESGSQRVLDQWAKGTELGVTSRFLHDAAEAGISIRVTMIHGAPDERPEDVDASADFLNRHRRLIDRVSLNRFQFMIGPTFQRRHDEKPSRNPSIIVGERQPRMATADHRMVNSPTRKYFLATQRLLSAVHAINKKKLPDNASVFEGVM